MRGESGRVVCNIIACSFVMDSRILWNMAVPLDSTTWRSALKGRTKKSLFHASVCEYHHAKKPSKDNSPEISPNRRVKNPTGRLGFTSERTCSLTHTSCKAFGSLAGTVRENCFQLNSAASNLLVVVSKTASVRTRERLR